MSRSNYLVEIRDDNHSSPESRFITVYAEDEAQANFLASVAAEKMREDFHKGREFYVVCVVGL